MPLAAAVAIAPRPTWVEPRVLLRHRRPQRHHAAGAVAAVDPAPSEVYGSLGARLEAEGRRLDEPDMRIASIALSRELTLVTGNVRHFNRVPDLAVESWLA